jgi:hypothetical protein
MRSGALYAALMAAKDGGCGIGGSSRRAEDLVLRLVDSMLQKGSVVVVAVSLLLYERDQVVRIANVTLGIIIPTTSG